MMGTPVTRQSAAQGQDSAPQRQAANGETSHERPAAYESLHPLPQHCPPSQRRTGRFPSGRQNSPQRDNSNETNMRDGDAETRPRPLPPGAAAPGSPGRGNRQYFRRCSPFWQEHTEHCHSGITLLREPRVCIRSEGTECSRCCPRRLEPEAVTDCEPELSQNGLSQNCCGA